jgi:hypothetical protein
MSARREAFRNGINLLLNLQKELGHRPKRYRVPKLVDKIIKKANFDGASNTRYFQLLAMSALMGREPMYNNFKPKRKSR